MCISMELVTAVLGDHGQRPREDYGKQYKEYPMASTIPLHNVLLSFMQVVKLNSLDIYVFRHVCCNISTIVSICFS